MLYLTFSYAHNPVLRLDLLNFYNGKTFYKKVSCLHVLFIMLTFLTILWLSTLHTFEVWLGENFLYSSHHNCERNMKMEETVHVPTKCICNLCVMKVSNNLDITSVCSTKTCIEKLVIHILDIQLFWIRCNVVLWTNYCFLRQNPLSSFFYFFHPQALKLFITGFPWRIFIFTPIVW